MNPPTQNMSLVSFSSSNSRQSLLKCLARKGFDNITTINNQSWLSEQQPDNHGLLLLQIDQLSKWRDKIIRKLRRLPRYSFNTTTLAIFNTADIAPDELLLNHCNEFITWPFNDSELAIRINKLSPLSVCGPDNQGLVDEFLHLNLIGQSQTFLNLLKNTKKISACDAPVLIEGKTGTGKELFAHAIHYLSSRCDAGFIPVNCGSLPDQLFINELFGHEKGAFTDAKSCHQGLIQKAEGGTLFLDEIEALSTKAQICLLRFLQDYRYRPLGSTQLKKANIRVISASNQLLKQLVEQGSFREDLYYRLNIMPLQIPTLKERIEDLSLLTNHFIRQYCEQYQQDRKEIHPAMLAWMQSYDWPGNIRELENMLHRAFLLSDKHLIYDPSLVDFRHEGKCAYQPIYPQGLTFKDAKDRVIKEFEINYLTHLIHESSGNVSQAAKKAGKERRALGKLLKKYKLK